jgi:hypothetical protein
VAEVAHAGQSRRPALRVALLAVAVVLVAAGAAVAGVVATHVRWPGDVAVYGSSVGSPERLGRTFAVEMGPVPNDSGRPLVVDEVRLHGADGAALTGVLAAHANAGVGATHGWPPKTTVKLQSVRGFRIPPHAEADLVVGIRPTRTGNVGVHGVDLLYHRRILGVTVRFRDHIGIRVALCARHTTREPRCTPPGFRGS